MNVLEVMNNVNKVGKYLIVAVLLLNLVSMVSAQGTSGIKSAMHDLCVLAQTFLGLAVIVLLVLAAAVYAIGQVMGAETRARAAVWATSMLTGAIIGLLIYIVAPMVLSKIMPTSGVSIVEGDPCSGLTA
jgi:hypothetical protein